MGRISQRGPVADQGQAGHQSAGAEQLYCASLRLYFKKIKLVIIRIIFSLFQLSNCSDPSPEVFFCDFPSHATVGVVDG